MVGPHPCRRSLLAMKAISPSGLAKMLSRNDSTAPFGPASICSTLARRHSDLMATILQQVLDLVRQRSEAVDQLGAEGLDLLLVLDVGKPAVEREPHRQVGDIILRDQHRRADGDLRRPAVGDRRGDAGLEARHRLFEHLLVELEADLLDVAGLLVAQQVAGAADVEIVGGELEAGAKRVERLQHLQPPLGLPGDLALRRQREQRIGAQLRATHPPAQLIELRQTEHVGAMHDQRVRGRNIEAGFDDRGREQHVVLAVVERRHDVFEHARRHLAVRDRDAHLRHVLVEEVLDPGDVLDARNT